MLNLLMLVVAASFPVSGQVVDTEGNPVPDAKVVIQDNRMCQPDRAEVVTGPDGRFRIEVGFKPFLARAEAQGFAQVAKHRWDEFVVVPMRGAVKLTLLKERRVTGIVVDENGDPLPEVRVSSLNNQQNSATTDSTGSFSLYISPKETHLWAYRKIYGHRNVEVAEGRPTTIVMSLLPTIALYLVDGSGKPVRGHQPAEVRTPDGEMLSSCNTRDAEGDCTLVAQLGEVVVSSTVDGKTVSRKVRLSDTKRVDVTLQF